MRGTPRRIVRALLAGGILAGGWFVVDMFTTPAPAAAASTIDLLPSGETPVADLIDTVTSVAPVATPVVEVLSPVVSPAASTVDAVAAPLAPVTTPVLAPVRAVTQPVVDTVVAPVLDGALEALTPVLEPVVDGLSPVVDSVLDGLPTADAGLLASQYSQRGAVFTPVFVEVLLSAAPHQDISTPGSPQTPADGTPGDPEGVSAGGTSMVGEAVAGLPVSLGIGSGAVSASPHPHSSPVFESDTFPD